LFFVNYLFK